MLQKTMYIPPLVEVLQMENYLESFCISGGDYTGSSSGFDDDSD